MPLLTSHTGRRVAACQHLLLAGGFFTTEPSGKPLAGKTDTYTHLAQCVELQL